MSDERTKLSVLSGNGDGPPAPPPPLAGAGDGGDGHPMTQQVELVTKPNDAAWIEAYIDRADEPIDFSPVKRRIRNRKLAAIEAENLSGEMAATEIVARTALFVPLPPARDPWEDTTDEN